MPALAPISLVLSLALALAPVPAPAPHDEAASVSAPHRVWLDAEAVEGLAEALRLRLAGREIFELEGRALEEQTPYAYVGVSQRGPSTYMLSLILSDGRGYAREVDAAPEHAPRVLATEIALLLRGIEGGTAVPDSLDSRVPSAALAAEAEAEADPAPDQPVAQPPEAPSNPRVLTVAITLTGGGALGLIPFSDIDASGMGGGGLGVDLRLPRAALVGAEFRATTRRAGGTRLIRSRFALVAGYVFARGRFELPVLGGLTAETWALLADRAPLAFMKVDEGPDDTLPLFGLKAAVAPAYRAETGRVLLRVGGFVEVAGSVAFTPRAAALRVYPGDASPLAPPLHRLGGVELAVGVLVGLAIPRTLPERGE